MKIDVMGLLRGAALELKRTDPGRAFCLLELGNNLRLVMRGDEPIDEFKKCYVGADGEPFDIDAISQGGM